METPLYSREVSKAIRFAACASLALEKLGSKTLPMGGRYLIILIKVYGLIILILVYGLTIFIKVYGTLS